MRKKILTLVYILTSSLCVAYEFGMKFDTEIISLEKSEFTPDSFLSINSLFYAGETFYRSNFMVQVTPAIELKDKKIYLNMYKFKLNYILNHFIFALDKDILWFGDGWCFNELVPQSLDILTKDNRSWFTKIDCLLNNFNLSMGAILDNSIDYYKKPDYLNPFFLATYNNQFVNAAYCLDILIDFSGNSPRMKHGGQISLTLPYDIYFYTSDSMIIQKEEVTGSIGLGTAKSFLFKNCTFVPTFEYVYRFEEEIHHFYFNINFDYASLFELNIMTEYSDEKCLKNNFEINILLKSLLFKFELNTGNYLEENYNFKDNFLLKMGVEYEI